MKPATIACILVILISVFLIVLSWPKPESPPPEQNYDNPTHEETWNWTVEDWNQWRRRHPRFDPIAP